MVTFEQVEKLRSHANVSYEDAKNALESTNGDILDAIILLEKQGKTSGQNGQNPNQGYRQNYEQQFGYQNPKWQKQKHIPTGYHEPSLWSKLMQSIRNTFRWSVDNHFIILKNGREVIKVPMFLFILLALCWVAVIPLLIVGLLFGFSYSFGGKELNTKNVNDAFDSYNKKHQNNNYNYYNQQQNPYNNYNNYHGSQNGFTNNQNNSNYYNHKNKKAEQQPYASPFKTSATAAPQPEAPFKNPPAPEAPYVSPFKNTNDASKSTVENNTNTKTDSENSSDNSENIQL